MAKLNIIKETKEGNEVEHIMNHYKIPEFEEEQIDLYVTFGEAKNDDLAKSFVEEEVEGETQLVKKDGGGFKGIAKTVKVDGVSGLKSILEGMDSTNVILSGFMKGKANDEVVRVEWANSLSHIDDITREGEHWGYEDRAGVMLIDEDQCEKSVDDLYNALLKAVPELESAPILHKPSSGSNVYKDGKIVIENRGNHHLIPVQDSRDIPRVLGVICKKLWLAGHGFIFVDSVGRTHPRTIIDPAVKDSGRIIYNKANVPEGYEQVHEITLHNEYEQIFNSLSIPNLSEAEEEKYDDLVLEAKLKPEVIKKVKENRKHFRKVQKTKGLSDKEIDRLMEGDKLPPNFILYFEFGEFPVEYVKDPKNKATFHNKYCCDAKQPDYQDGKFLCWVNLEDEENMFLHSHAHGGIRYTLDGLEVFTYEDLVDQVRSIPGNDDGTLFNDVVANVVGSDLSPFQRGKLIKLFKGVVDLNMPEIRESIAIETRKQAGARKFCKDDSEVAIEVLNFYGKSKIFTHEGNLFKWEYRRKGVWGQVKRDILSKRILITLRKYAEPGFTNSNIKSILAMIIYDTSVDCVDKLAPDNVINVKNCELWILQDESGEFYIEQRKHDRRTYSTQQLNVNYNPNANSRLMESFLNTAFYVDESDDMFFDLKDGFLAEKYKIALNDSELKKKLLLESSGYMFTTSTKLEAFFQYYGCSRTGKSIFCKLVRAIIGSEHVVAVKGTMLGDEYERARMFNTLLAVDNETEDDSKFPAGVVKAISSGDLIGGRHPFGRTFDYVPTCTLLFLSNYLLRIQDPSGATDQRYYIIEFDRRFMNQGRYINGGRPGVIEEIMKGKGSVLVSEDFDSSNDKLNDERVYEDVEDDGIDGVFTMCLHAYVFGALDRRENNRGVEGNSFILPESAKKLKKQVRSMGDPYIKFLEQCTHIKSMGGTGTREMFNVYAGWKTKLGVKGHEDFDQFRKVVKEQGHVIKTRKGRSFINNLKINEGIGNDIFGK